MKVFLIGGTGLLGSAAARELIARGHEIYALALPPEPPAGWVPKGLQLELADYSLMDDAALSGRLAGCDALVFAAGVDERVESPPPVYDFFHRHNIAPLHRLMRLARTVGVRRMVVFGSYFVHFDRIWPDMRLAEVHPYIRSRVDQEALALSFADEQTAVTVLELPYIFGAQPGRRPVWVFLVDQLRRMGRITFYPRGGTTMVTVRQVAQAVAGALSRESGAKALPVGYYNRTWREMLRVMYAAMGQPHQPILTIPTWMYRIALRQVSRKTAARGVESGLNLAALADLMSRRAFIASSEGTAELGVEPDDIDAAIAESIHLSMDVLDGRTEVIGMQSGWQDRTDPDAGTKK